jgi:hypothetical protein
VKSETELIENLKGETPCSWPATALLSTEAVTYAFSWLKQVNAPCISLASPLSGPQHQLLSLLSELKGQAGRNCSHALIFLFQPLSLHKWAPVTDAAFCNRS